MNDHVLFLKLVIIGIVPSILYTDHYEYFSRNLDLDKLADIATRDWHIPEYRLGAFFVLIHTPEGSEYIKKQLQYQRRPCVMSAVRTPDWMRYKFAVERFCVFLEEQVPDFLSKVFHDDYPEIRLSELLDKLKKMDFRQLVNCFIRNKRKDGTYILRRFLLDD